MTFFINIFYKVQYSQLIFSSESIYDTLSCKRRTLLQYSLVLAFRTDHFTIVTRPKFINSCILVIVLLKVGSRSPRPAAVCARAAGFVAPHAARASHRSGRSSSPCRAAPLGAYWALATRNWLSWLGFSTSTSTEIFLFHFTSCRDILWHEKYRARIRCFDFFYGIKCILIWWDSVDEITCYL